MIIGYTIGDKSTSPESLELEKVLYPGAPKELIDTGDIVRVKRGGSPSKQPNDQIGGSNESTALILGDLLHNQQQGCIAT